MESSPPFGADRQLGTPIVRLGAVTSTMDIARAIEHYGGAEGLAIVAALQTQGRGRAGRTWQSAAGSGLYCSIVLRPCIPVSQFQPFAIVAGLSICDALDPHGDFGLQLKWPNDIVCRARKLAGLLITTTLQGDRVASAVLGFGLNLTPDGARPDTAISLTECRASADQPQLDPFPAIARSLSLRYSALCVGDIETAMSDWRERLAFLNQTVAIQDGTDWRTGIVRGLDHIGALLIETPDGIIAIHAGELTRGPRPMESAFAS